jgi:CBS domain-containing protein
MAEGDRWPTAGELMTPDPITLPPDAPLSRAIGLMRSHSIHELPVLRGKSLAGMITFESIARRTNLALTTKVEHLMVLPPIVPSQTAYPDLAEQLLAAGVRAAPVTGRRGELVGVVSRTDLVRALPELGDLGRHRVEEVMSPPGLLVRDTEPVLELFARIRILEEHPLPVVDRRGRLVGAVGVADLGHVLWRPVGGGKRDAVRHAPRRPNVFDVEVRTIMRSPALTVPRGTATGDAARLMSREKASSVFVVDGGRPVGVVSQNDLLGLAVGAGEPRGATPVEDVYVQIHGLRGSGDPATLTEIDRIVAKGLRHISRHVRPTLLSLHITPHATHRSGDATVQARLHTDREIYYASKTEWNFFAGIAALMDELAEQTRRAREDGRHRGRRRGKAVVEDETVVDRDLEERIRRATGPDDSEE